MYKSPFCGRIIMFKCVFEGNAHGHVEFEWKLRQFSSQSDHFKDKKSPEKFKVGWKTACYNNFMISVDITAKFQLDWLCILLAKPN